MAGFRGVLEKAAENYKALELKDVIELLGAGPEERPLLYAEADRVRSARVGEDVHLRGIIEFSNHCACLCRYCGLRKGNRAIERYRMQPDEILESARNAAGLGLKTIVLQSGEDPFYTQNILSEIIFSIKKELDVAVTLSVGVRPSDELAAFRKAGADRYLLKHETADPGLFAALRPGTFLKERVSNLRHLKDLGFQAGSGNMVGLPGQTVHTVARDLLLMRELNVEMAGIGPFIPHPGTPLGEYPPGNLHITLTTLAVARLVMPGIHLPATTALATLHRDGRRLALQCGANVIMPNVTPLKYRPHYSIYPNKTGIDREPGEAVSEAVSLIEGIGRGVGRGYGHATR
ncbi:MAG: [FeFe] hydrogenase H-cluster radical SAM maturase HydE [Bacillota bacterium]